MGQWPLPSKSKNVPVPNQAGLLTAPYAGSIQTFAGRYLDSTMQSQHQEPLRTLRAWHAELSPNGGIYIQLGSGIADYGLADSFISRLLGDEPMIPVTQLLGVPDRGANPEMLLRPNVYWYPRNDPEWQRNSSQADGDIRVFRFDIDERGFVYPNTDAYGWGILDANLSTLSHEAQIDAHGGVCLRRGDAFFRVVSPSVGSSSRLYDVTDPRNPINIGTAPYVVSGPSAHAANGDVALIDSAGLLRIIFESEPVASHGDIRSPLSDGAFYAVACDGIRFYGVLHANGGVTKIVVFTKSGALYDRREITLDIHYNEAPSIVCGAGYIGLAGVEQSGNLWAAANLRLFRIDALGELTAVPLLVGAAMGSPVDQFIPNYYSSAVVKLTPGYVAPSFTGIGLAAMAECAILPSGGRAYVVLTESSLGDVLEVSDSGAPPPPPPTPPVDRAPVIVAQPQSSVDALSVAAIGTQPITYQWYRGQTGDVSQPVAGATSPTFAAPPAGVYWVRVSNAIGHADSVAAGVTFPPPPSKVPMTKANCFIGIGPDAAVDAGVPFSVYVQTLGWQLSDEVVAWDFGDGARERSTAEFGRISHVWSKAGSFTITLTVTRGSEQVVNTAPIKVNGPQEVPDPPRILEQPRSATLPRGGTVTLSVTAAGAAPLTYQWYLGSRGDTSQPATGGLGASILVAFAGDYWVRVSNRFGAVDSQAAIVTEQLPPPPPPPPPADGEPFEVRLPDGSRLLWYPPESAAKGIQIGVCQVPEVRHAWQAPAPTLESWKALRELGVVNLRLQFDLAVVSPKPGDWDTSVFEQWFRPALAAGLTVHPNIVFGEKTVAGSFVPAPAHHTAAWRYDAAARMAKDYGSLVGSYGLGNEPGDPACSWMRDDVSRDGQRDGIRGQYFPDFIVPIVEGIRSVQRDAKITGFEADSAVIQQRCMQAAKDLGEEIDVQTVHPYGDVGGGDYATMALFASVRDASKPWVIGEVDHQQFASAIARGADRGVASDEEIGLLAAFVREVQAKYADVQCIYFGTPEYFFTRKLVADPLNLFPKGTTWSTWTYWPDGPNGKPEVSAAGRALAEVFNQQGRRRAVNARGVSA